jgi:hypothetical protein
LSPRYPLMPSSLRASLAYRLSYFQPLLVDQLVFTHGTSRSEKDEVATARKAVRGGFTGDVVLTGLPRSGSTLVCALLNLVPGVVALHEPMPLPDWASRMTRETVIREIDRFFAEARNSLLHTGTAPSRQVDARVPSNPFADEKDASGLRHARGVLGLLALAPGTVLALDFTLVVKHTAGFAALLEQLNEDHPCFAVIREPIATMASWATINAPIRTGRTPAAERLDPRLSAALDKIEGVLDRQIHILEWYLERFRSLPADRVIRYEAVVASGGQSLRAIAPAAAELSEPLSLKNDNPLYEREQMIRVGRALLARSGVLWDFYDRANTEQGLAALTDRR